MRECPGTVRSMKLKEKNIVQFITRYGNLLNCVFAIGVNKTAVTPP